MNSAKSNKLSAGTSREDGVSNSERRPHKKARFAWQIKGNYHLKNAKKQMNEPTNTQTESHEPPSEDSSSKSTVELVDNNTLDAHVSSSLISPPDSPIETTKPEKGSKHHTPWFPSPVPAEETRSLASYTSRLQDMRGFYSIHEMDQKREANSQFLSMMVYRDNMRYVDYCISEWQADQIEKSIMDNAINSILEVTRTNISAETNHRITQHIEEVRDNNVVDNGIGMAIAAYGLQCAENIPEQQINESNEINQCVVDEINSAEHFGNDTELIPSKFLDEDARKSSSDNTDPAESSDETSAIIPSATDIHNPSTDTDITKGDENTEQIPSVLLDETETNSENGSDNALEGCTCSSEDITAAISMPEPDLVTTDDYAADFMNTAVLHAIQSKGLVTTWTGFG